MHFNLHRIKFSLGQLFVLGFVVLCCFIMSICVSADWAGWVLTGLIFLTIFFVKDFRENKKLFWTLFFIILAHNVISIINVYFYLLFGWDAAGFHQHAWQNAALTGGIKFALFAKFYIYILSVFYKICASKFFGQEISVLFFTMSCVIFIKFQKLIGIKKHRAFSLLLFGLAPAYLFWGSVTLREPLELFFIMLAVYSGIHFRLVDSKKILYFCMMIFSSLIFGAFHWALPLFIPLLILILLFWPLNGIKKEWLLSVFVLLLIIFVGIYLLFVYADLLPMDLHELVKAALCGDLVRVALHRIQVFQRANGSGVARTAYLIVLDFTSFISIIKSMFMLVSHYLFGPFPWAIRSLVELLLMFYAWVRMAFLIGFIIAIKLTQRAKRQVLILMLIVYLTLAVLYALGTANYGTALRHQMLTDWILFLFGSPVTIFYVMKFLRKCCKYCGARNAFNE
jgi:hypothetical protein